jgi:glycosyltransferase involved in cell wall biosynthesis
MNKPKGKMDKPKITIVIPTYNRPQAIAFLLKKCLNNFDTSFYSLQVHDSSQNDDTQKIIFDFNQNNNNIIIYKRYDATINGDKKTMLALKEVTTPFLYLLGDGVAPNLAQIEDIFKAHGGSDFQIIGFCPQKRKEEEMKTTQFILLENCQICAFLSSRFDFIWYFYHQSITDKTSFPIWDSRETSLQ